MIYYFSTTGNSRWVAEQLAQAIDEQAVSITAMRKDRRMPPAVKSGESLGIVFPVYAWTPPRVVVEFVRQLKVEDGAFVYGVCTMASFAGDALRYLQKYIRLDSGYSIRMPNNYLMMSNRESDDMIAAKIAKAKKIFPVIAESIKARKSEFKIKKGFGARLFTGVGSVVFNRLAGDRAFRAGESCTGCGLCVKLCPLDNITLENGKPVWHGDCMHCVACIQNCPVTAIDYGHKTVKRLRYGFRELE